MSSPSNDTAPSDSNATPPVPPPASPPQAQKRPLLRASSVIDLTGAAPTEEEAGPDTQEAKRVRDESFKAVVEDERRVLVKELLKEIGEKHKKLVAVVRGLCPARDGEFLLEIDHIFALSFSDTFIAIGQHAKSK